METTRTETTPNLQVFGQGGRIVVTASLMNTRIMDTERNKTKRIVDTARLMITRIMTTARNKMKRLRPERTNDESEK